jgi:hypothetical protein
MNIKEMNAVIRSVESDRLDPTGIVIEFVKGDGTRSPIILKAVSRTGVDPNNKGDIEIKPRLKDCEALVEWVAELVNTEVARLKSPSLSKVIEDWFRRFQGNRVTLVRTQLAKFGNGLNRGYGVTSVSDYIDLLHQSKPRTDWHNGGFVRFSHPFQDIFETNVFETFFAILQDAKVDFGMVLCGEHGVFIFREPDDPSKN